MKLINLKFNQGVTSLALVTIVSLIMVAIILMIQLITLLTVRVAAINIAEKSAFYSAEGVLYDTIVRLNRGEAPSSINTTPVSPNPEFVLNRSVTQTGDLYEVNISASGQYASRHLFSSFRRVTSSAPLLDIALIIDESGSMDDMGCFTCSQWVAKGHNLNCTGVDPTYQICQPLFSAQAAAKVFIDTLAANPAGPSAQVSMIKYSKTGKVIREMAPGTPDNYAELTNKLQTLHASGNTNIHHSLQLVKDNIGTWRPPSQTNRIVVLLTDGLPNQMDAGPTNCSPGYPDNITSSCISSAISVANDLKTNEEVSIYTIGLGLSETHGYIQAPQIDVGHYVLDNIASTPPSNYAYYTSLNQLNELQDAFSNILHQVLANPYLKIRECTGGVPCPI